VSPPLLSARAFFRDPIEYVRTWGGDAAALRLAAGPKRFALVREPEAIWNVLVTDARSFRPGKWKRRARRFVGPTLNTLDGEQHRTRRLLLQPSLDRRRIAGFVPAIAARTVQAQAAWEDSTRIPLRDELDRLSLLVAGDVLLSTELDADADQLVELLRAVAASVPRLTPPIPGTPQRRALVELERRVAALLHERRRSPRARDDLAQSLLGSGLPDRTARGELIAFLLAAVDEPPSALEAAWYLLGRNPETERRFHEELDATPGTGAGLPYCDAVLSETLRLFPPARYIDRCPLGDERIGGLRVRAGSNVLLSPLVTQREPHLYDRAGDFVPERWLDGSAERPRGAYLPFGAGAHTCIGEPLARAIVNTALVEIGRRWRLRIDDDAPLPIPRSPRLTVTLERR
jgi:cytochrome P450